MEGSIAKERAREFAQDHGGRISYALLVRFGLTGGEIEGWIRRGELIRTRPRVYAVGYVRTDLLARVWEAILYAGPGAYLTGTSGAYQRGLVDYPPSAVKVATPRRCASLPGIIVLQARPGERELVNGVPVAPVPELMLEMAAEGDFNLVRKALSSLEFRRELDIAALLAACGHGRRGARLLRRALHRRLPQLAYCRSPLEVAFLLWLEANHLTLPKFNVHLHGILVDVLWKDLGLVIELDGGGNHGTAYQKRRDADYMATLRGHGLSVDRFDWWDVHIPAKQRVMHRRLAELGVQRAAASARSARV
jgi:very-short-patch-repair endonuclease